MLPSALRRHLNIIFALLLMNKRLKFLMYAKTSLQGDLQNKYLNVFHLNIECSGIVPPHFKDNISNFNLNIKLKVYLFQVV